MKVTTAHQVLKAFRNTTVRTTSDMLVHKVATRWVVANMNQEYDLMIRTQVLEGLAGVHPNSWVRKGGKQGLETARKFFMDTYPGNQIQPGWWDPTSVETIRVLWAVAKQNITRFRINADPFEFINSALMGVAADPSKPAERLLPAYQLGVKDRSPILKKMRDSDEIEEQPAPHHIIDGKITPTKVAQTGLSKALYFRIADYADRLKKETDVPEDEKGVTQDLPDFHNRGQSLEAFMSSLMFGDAGNDPLPAKIQQTMRDAWVNNSLVDKWFGQIHMTGEVPTQNEFARLQNVFSQTLGRSIQEGLEKAVRAIWNNVPLRKEIAERMIQENVQGDLPETLKSISKRKDVKVASSYMLRSILASYPAWLIRRAGTKIR